MFASTMLINARVTLPVFKGVRVMMMPFHTHDVEDSVPEDLFRWVPTIERMCEYAPAGVGYLTIDESLVRAGETHRRPGLHVDGIGPDGRAGGWGGGGGYASEGMVMVASHYGCNAYPQAFDGYPGPDGDCEHLRGELRARWELQAGFVYQCRPLLVHEAIPMVSDTKRSFCRVSFPSPCPWYEGYTPNPKGILPEGPIHPERVAQMDYRR